MKSKSIKTAVVNQAVIPIDYRGWWRITETTTWMKEDLDALGMALISLTGSGDRLRMLYLLAHTTCKATKTGVSFRWKGAWEFDQLSGGRFHLAEPGSFSDRSHRSVSDVMFS